MFLSNTCCGEQFVVPTGGITGVGIGAMDGVTMGQIRGGQIGGISFVFEQMVCCSPFMHWQEQLACATFNTK